MRSKQERITYKELNRMIEANKLLLTYCPGGEQIYIPYKNLHGIKMPFTFMQHIIGDHADMSETDFTFSDLSHSDFVHANFCKTRAMEANFSHCNLSGADFRYAYMPGASFFRAEINHAKFKHADLARADFTHSYIYDTDFIDCNLSCSPARFDGAMLINVKIDCSNQFQNQNDLWNEEEHLISRLLFAQKLENVTFIGADKKVQILEKE